MRSSILQALSLALFSTRALANISSPASGDQWPVDSNQMVTWDTTGLDGPIDIHLVPSTAIDATVIITEISLQVDNTGSLQWSPPETVDVMQAKVLIVDSKQVTVISDVFIIVLLDTTKTTSTKKLSTSTKLISTTLVKLTTTSLKVTTAKVVTISSTIMTTKPLTTSTKVLTTPAIILTTAPTSKATALVASTSKISTSTSIKALTSTVKPVTTTAKALTTSMVLGTVSSKVTSKVANITMSTPLIQANVTAAAAKATFTGAASHMVEGRGYEVLVGGVLSVLGFMVF
ncbi:uncharacterized protein LY89DRAFT_739545 [Mollisia scopiformis]|uniref:Uncharacterized protein n=1 Tax=Mollisia scopiformis TaxID=149040 RepID=A0A194WUK3_MOLSC|nr:uncharacterized protein LY89DRAFT_739545 [Mollisia scopiformis]KUJ11349.1 hypothetical protein LY89DRAFT_739545 [Mollisia scopiformis]